MNEELKPCPFCGSNDLRKSKDFTIKDKNLICLVCDVQCNNCGCDGPKLFYTNDTVKAWNERK